MECCFVMFCMCLKSCIFNFIKILQEPSTHKVDLICLQRLQLLQQLTIIYHVACPSSIQRSRVRNTYFSRRMRPKRSVGDSKIDIDDSCHIYTGMYEKQDCLTRIDHSFGGWSMVCEAAYQPILLIFLK